MAVVKMYRAVGHLRINGVVHPPGTYLPGFGEGNPKRIRALINSGKVEMGWMDEETLNQAIEKQVQDNPELATSKAPALEPTPEPVVSEPEGTDADPTDDDTEPEREPVEDESGETIAPRRLKASSTKKQGAKKSE